MGPEDLVSERHVLEFKRFAQAMAVDAGIMAEMEFRVGPAGSYDFLCDQITVQMVTKLLTDDLPPERVTQSTMIKVQEPRSTWQMWKFQNGHHWFARWFVDRWPIKYREYEKSVRCEFDLQRYRAYPRARVQSPILGNAVMFHDIRDVRWDGE
jgi:hypothetical protein